MQTYNKNSEGKSAILSFRRILLLDLGVLSSLLQANVGSLSLQRGVLQKDRKEAEFMQERAKGREALMAALNNKLGQQLAIMQKHVASTRRSLLEYHFKLSFDIGSCLEKFRRPLLDSACENVQSP